MWLAVDIQTNPEPATTHVDHDGDVVPLTVPHAVAGEVEVVAGVRPASCWQPYLENAGNSVLLNLEPRDGADPTHPVITIGGVGRPDPEFDGGVVENGA